MHVDRYMWGHHMSPPAYQADNLTRQHNLIINEHHRLSRSLSPTVLVTMIYLKTSQASLIWNPALSTLATALSQEDCNRISVPLRDILSVDKENLIIRSEPLVDMRYMTRHLVPMGLQLAIQVEVWDICLWVWLHVWVWAPHPSMPVTLRICVGVFHLLRVQCVQSCLLYSLYRSCTT